jgi:transcription antitermination factor NusG
MNETLQQWYAVYTMPKWEKKIAATLDLIGVENYCPLNLVERRWSDRIKRINEPLFRGYLFVRPAASEMSSLLSVKGILNYVRIGKEPAIIREHEIDLIKRFLRDYSDIRIEDAKGQFHTNDSVIITSGPFVDMKGVVIRTTEKTARVEIRALNCFLLADVSKCDLKKH